MKFNLNKISYSTLAMAGLFVLVVGGGFVVIHNRTEVQQEVQQDSSLDFALLTDETIAVESTGSEPEAAAEVAPEPVEEPTPSAPADMDVFAKCLTDNGAVFYGASWCPHCQKQKKAFGESVQYVNYVECAVDGGKTQAGVCEAAGVTFYPTWRFVDSSEIVGEATFQELSEKTNCPL
jgi:thiol-disulfide isomerase/thioredoxin